MIPWIVDYYSKRFRMSRPLEGHQKDVYSLSARWRNRRENIGKELRMLGKVLKLLISVTILPVNNSGE